MRITREGSSAVIAYLDPTVATTHLELGCDTSRLSDQQILERFNETMRARDALVASHKHVAIEIPAGKPQVEYFAPGDQWVPRGHVVRCIVDDGGPDGEPIIDIDGREFSLREFGRMLTSFAGWGLRVCVVPAEEIEKEPTIEVREPG